MKVENLPGVAKSLAQVLHDMTGLGIGLHRPGDRETAQQIDQSVEGQGAQVKFHYEVDGVNQP